jgi:diguanylate cyclase (GGDEF)-like protein/PAS domain S-box-containing protein
MVRRRSSSTSQAANGSHRSYGHVSLNKDGETAWQAFIDCFNNPVLILSSDCNVIHVNEAATGHFNIAREKIIGSHFPTAFRDENNISIDCPAEKCTKTKKRENIEFYLEKKGSWIRINAYPILKTNQEIDKVLCIIEDFTLQKKIETDKHEIENRFLAIFDSIYDVIIILDTKGIIRDVSPSIEKMLGYSPGELIGKNTSELYLLTPESKQMAIAEIRRGLKGERIKLAEYILIAKNGEERICEVNLSPILHEDKVTGLIAVARNITKRKKNEQLLIEEATKHRILIEQSTDGIVVMDSKGGVYEANKRFADMLGYSLEEVKKLHVWEWDTLFPRDQLDQMVATVDEAGDHFETVHRRKDGTTYDVEISTNGAVIAGQKLVFCVCRDITIRKQMEESLKESEEQYKAIVDNPLTGIFIVQDEKCVFCNERFAQMHGYEVTELLKKTTLPLVHPDYQEWSYLRVEQVSTGERPPEVGEQLRMKKNGDTFWAESIITPLLYKGKKAVAGTVLDITDRKKAQEETNKAHDELTKALSKLEKRNYENSIMSEMRDLIQVASSMSEIPPIVQSTMEKLFPNSGGALFIMSPSKSDLESASRWGGFPEDVDDNVFSPDSCWALRRGRAHIVEDIKSGTICPHLKHLPDMAYACIPMVAKSEVIGLLHLRDSNYMNEQDRQTLIETLHDIAAPLSEYLSLAIANLKLRETLKYQSIKDPLTGLFNRRFMIESFNREIARATRKQTKISLVMIDIDHFKNFNDSWGHAAGDELLIQLGKLFKERIRECDIACRYGGEEFVILMAESNIEDTFKRADKLREDTKNIRAYVNGQLLPPVSMSMGIAEYPTHGKNVDDLLHIADTALYRAKQEGRDKVIIA